jgi:Restriction endonuclease/AAA domain
VSTERRSADRVLANLVANRENQLAPPTRASSKGLGLLMYDFATLSPNDFELLVRDLLKIEQGWRLEAFGIGKDGGVDLRCVTPSQKVVVQCKHYAGSSFADLRTAARREVAKMQKEKPDRYLFVTSQTLSRTQKDTLVVDLAPWISNPADILMQVDLNEMLARNPDVERAHFKLWLGSSTVLETIVHSGLWARSEALLEDIRDRVRLYVRSPAFDRALKRLNESNVVVITGPPGVGKSLLAEMLVLEHWHKGWQVIQVSSDINEAWELIQPKRHQIFLYDDFLGETDISERSAKNEDSRIVRFMHRVSQDDTKRLVMTTRSQVLRQATFRRETLRRGDFSVNECVVDVTEYGDLDKARILYNHLYFSHLERDVVRGFVSRKSYWQVINHPNFSPRVIEQIVRRRYTAAEDLANALILVLDRPVELWGTMFFTVLSEVARRIVLSLIMFSSAPGDDVVRAVSIKDAAPTAYTQALKALEGTFISIEKRTRGAGSSIGYANPSIRDFVLATLDDEPDYAFRLIADASDLYQVRNVLKYATSRVNGRFKFARLADAVRAKQATIFEKTVGLLDAAVAKHRARKGERYDDWDSRTAVSFGQILAMQQWVLPDYGAALLDKALDIQDEAFMDFADFWGPVTEIMIRQAQGNVAPVREAIDVLLGRWQESMNTSEEIVEFSKFVESNHTALSQLHDPQVLLRSVATDVLRRDMEAIFDNHSNENSDQDWLAQIQSVADSLGLGNEMRSEFESASVSISEHYQALTEDDDYSRVAPTSGAGFGRPAGTYVDRHHVDAMFGQLG